jgi:DNA repair protein RecO
MAYPIYTTPGFIVSSYKTGEADKLLQIFTRDLGMVFVKAAGIRKLESKLRGHIQDYNLGLFSMVQGKSGWRLVNGDVFAESFPTDLTQKQTRALSRVSSLLKRLYLGEEPNEKLFDDIISFFNHELFLENEKLGVFEIVLGVRVLEGLGYIGENSVCKKIADMGSEIDSGFILKNQKAVISEINKALADSQL